MQADPNQPELRKAFNGANYDLLQMSWKPRASLILRRWQCKFQAHTAIGSVAYLCILLKMWEDGALNPGLPPS